MTDSKLLRAKIEKSGKTLTHLAGRLGLSKQGFYNKLEGKTGFYSNEIIVLTEELSLSREERENIFFNQKVDT